MTVSLVRRRQILALPLLSLLPAAVFAAVLPPGARSAMLAFDALYIPALFLTGSAGKSAEGPAKASAAMQRLMTQWPAQRKALEAAVPGQRIWIRSLDAVYQQLAEGATLVAAAQWERSHEVLEHVREIQFEARQTLNLDYALDRFTAFHTAMEAMANATSVQRPALDVQFAKARTLWREIEMLTFDARDYGLSPERVKQLEQARQEESAALSRLSAALDGASDADLLKAAAATKPPFVKAYLAFGAGA